MGSVESVAPDGPKDLSGWGLHCFCPTARRTPHAVVAEGSNGQLLFAARGGASRRMLEAQGLPTTDRQLLQLTEFGLLDVDGDALHTAFPILDTAQTSQLRRQVRLLGGLLAERLATPVAALCRCLERMGLGPSAYAVVFGYALDGLVWDRLASGGAIPDTTLCAARPWWNGAFWAVYPPRDGAAGTNFVDCGDATLVQVWTTTTVDRLATLAAVPELPAAVRGLLDTGGTESPGVVVDATGAEWPLRGPDGRPAIPILGLGETPDQFAGELADIVAEALLGDAGAAAQVLVPCDDARIATVVLAHELLWSITEALLTSGLVDPARSLTAAYANTSRSAIHPGQTSNLDVNLL